MDENHNVTRILSEWKNGDPDALERLIPLVYGELHRQARIFLRRERPDHTLQSAALINEAYMKLVDQRNINYENRTHFFAIAGQLMRRILVDHARSKHREKRGGQDVPLPLDDALNVAKAETEVDVLALDEALGRLAEMDEQQARIVELRYFAGLTLEETAEAMEMSRTRVAEEWGIAKAWLHRELTR